MNLNIGTRCQLRRFSVGMVLTFSSISCRPSANLETRVTNSEVNYRILVIQESSRLRFVNIISDAMAISSISTSGGSVVETLDTPIHAAVHWGSGNILTWERTKSGGPLYLRRYSKDSVYLQDCSIESTCRAFSSPSAPAPSPDGMRIAYVGCDRLLNVVHIAQRDLNLRLSIDWKDQGRHKKDQCFWIDNQSIVINHGRKIFIVDIKTGEARHIHDGIVAGIVADKILVASLLKHLYYIDDSGSILMRCATRDTLTGGKGYHGVDTRRVSADGRFLVYEIQTLDGENAIGLQEIETANQFVIKNPFPDSSFRIECWVPYSEE